MTAAEELFEIVYEEHPIAVRMLHIKSRMLFLVNIPGKKPVFFTRAVNSEGVYFWTSIPEGNLELAQAIGPLIEQHIKSP